MKTPARLLLPALLVAGLALTGCAGNHADSGSSDSGAAADAPAAAVEGQVDGFAADGGSNDVGANLDYAGSAPAKARSAPDPLADQQALIKKGNVALRADDVGRARIEVQKVVDRYAGQVTDEKTNSDDDGEPAYTRMVVRVPSADFTRAIEGLKDVGELESASTNQDDVTTQVIDVQSRLQVQRRSIARITVLFQQAQGIRDIMAIESELSRRQADLEALEKQSAYLADQTSLSTIVVSVDQIPPKQKAEPKKDDKTGFVAGLSAGWDALSTFAVGLATAVGALLPWVVVVGLVGIPTLLLVRSLRRRTPAPATPAVDAGQASE